MKWILVLIFVVGCAQLPVPSEVAIETLMPVAVEVPQPKPVETPRPQKKRVRVMVASLTGFVPAQDERFRKISERLEEVINSEEFENGVRSFTFDKKLNFVDTEDSNDKVFESVTKEDWILEYRLESMRGSTVGYTLPKVKWIAINKAKFNHMDDADIACNIVHEYGGHKLGRYGHSKRWNRARDYSVPYGIGYLAERIYRKMYP